MFFDSITRFIIVKYNTQNNFTWVDYEHKYSSEIDVVNHCIFDKITCTIMESDPRFVIIIVYSPFVSGVNVVNNSLSYAVELASDITIPSGSI